MKEKDRLYNSRLTRIYLDYLGFKYPDINVKRLLEHAGMSKLEVDDPAHWFNQDQVDHFHDILVKETGNENISREAGRYATSSEGIGLVKQYALKFINPANIYALTGKLMPLLTHGAAIRSRRMGPTQVEITATPFPGVQEKPYQCDNRIGSFESVGMQFSNQYARVKHPECFHRGDDCCRYIISWEKSPVMLWKHFRNYSFCFDVLAGCILLYYLPGLLGMAAVLGLALKTALITIYGLHLEKKDLTRTIGAQGDAAQEHIHEINTRYSNALLVQEVGKATATILNKNELITTVMGIMQNRLGFDRGSILLADRDRLHLDYIAGYGFERENEGALRQMRFNLNHQDSKGIFVQSFRDQKPLIVEDIDKIKHQFSAKSQQLLESIKARSLICVPIIYEKQALGIIAVDNEKSQKKLSQSDLNLIMGIASQLAVGINNTESFRKLQKSEQRYRDIFENVSDYLYFHDLKGKIIESNRSFQNVSGYTDEELARMHIKELIPERYQSEFDTYLNQIMRDGNTEGSMRLVKKNGAEFLIEYKNSIVYSKDQPVGIRGSARDVTERWLSRKEKRGLERKLEQAQKMEAIGTLAGGVAHDLNNILSGIVSYPDLLLMDLPKKSHLREPIQTIRDSGQKAAAIVQDLLTMARRGVTVTDVVNLKEVISDYLASPEHVKLTSFHHDLRIDCHLADNTLNIMGSPVHLAKTIMNLVSNAAEAMPEGGRISITTENRYIDTPLQGYDIVEEGDYVVFQISDTGIGIPEKDQKRIFEPFYTKKMMGRSGTGLGMSVVWATVKDHKGYIDVASDIGSGTTFTLYFPATRKLDLQVASARSIEEYMGQGEHILVVDDVHEQREIASVMLRRLGYTVESASSGEDALAMARNHAPDLVVLDMIMDPGIDGLETYRKLLEINAGQKAIIASGFSESEKVRTALRIGAGAYIKKPYLLDKIGLAVRAELNR
jgi:PAS domain S-box-containing protein